MGDFAQNGRKFTGRGLPMKVEAIAARDRKDYRRDRGRLTRLAAPGNRRPVATLP
jgi:hypothetical protein